MLTVDYDRLDLRAGHRLLDLGCGFGRHAFEALRRGATVVASDMALAELDEVRAVYGAMEDDGELAAGVSATSVCADATRLPFPDASFDRVIASEVLEHIPADADALAELARVLAPGGMLAVTVPSWLPEKICWAISDEYHAPKVEGGHLRIYRRRDLEAMLTAAGLEPHDAHRAHALHSPYWWLRCAVGIDNDANPLVKAYLRLLTWDITEAPLVTRWADRALNPLIGKSIVVYARRPPVARGAAAEVEEMARVAA